ncbi:hypothetical protein GAY33_19100 [Azospirillum brasilense]|uniref:hypothetical protein n=1 Tax=Azospirillum argentinense TaxID=2970906 RepID=UPI00190F063F|nr:hypothetical protein [Azospirillum argentinense]MBK3801304.1 hypothetical protein [Azospirillum argentinense]
MRYDTTKVLIAGIGHYLAVERRPATANFQTTFPAELVRPLWDAGLVGGADLDSLTTTTTGLAALATI